MPNQRHLLFFTSKEMDCIAVRSWISALGILFGQKMCRILLKHLFWNTSSMRHIPLVTFQNPAAYDSTLSALLLKMGIFVFLLIFFVFHNVLQSRKCSPCLVDSCLEFSLCVSIVCHFGSHLCELCYLFCVMFSGSYWVYCLTVLPQCFGFVFFDTKSNFAAFLTSLSVLLCMSLWLCVSRYMSSAKSRYPIDFVNAHMIPLLTLMWVLFII